MRIVYIILASFLLSLSSTAQVLPDTGMNVSSSYSGGTIDQIDLFTGNAFVYIPIVSYPQLGGLQPLQFSISFNTAPFTQYMYCDPTDPYTCYQDGSTQGHVATLIQANYQNIGMLTLVPDVDPNGTGSGILTMTDETGAPHYFVEEQNYNNILYADDGSGYVFQGLGQEPTILYRPDGISITSGVPINGTYAYGASVPLSDYIKDLNGNTIQHTNYYPADQPQSQQSQPGQWLDSVGRHITDFFAWGNLSSDVSQCPNLNIPGQPPLFSVPWSVPGPPVQGSSAGTITYLVCFIDYEKIQSIKLPDGTFWGFQYDTTDYDFSMISEIRYPTGAKLDYQYAMISRWPDFGDPNSYIARACFINTFAA